MYGTSYDVKALITFVPVYPAVNTIKNKLEQNAKLPIRASMSIPNIIALLGFCLKNIYFLFQGMSHEQVQGAAMGSPISLNEAILFIDEPRL